MRRIILTGILIALTMTATAKPSWNAWVSQFRTEAIADGIEPSFFDQIFRDLQPNPQVMHFDRTQPEKRLSYEKYVHTRASSDRIAIGRREFQRNRALLEKIGREFQVDPCMIVSLWGMESSYGKFMGGFPVIRSLATLAYDNRRADFFRSQLKQALHIVSDGHVSLANFKGEWAGASGQPQFLPSSWYKYAVDYDGDGKKDIWFSLPDVFASIANYLKMNGWRKGEPVMAFVQLPSSFNSNLSGRETEKSVQAWESMGIHSAQGGALPLPNASVSVFEPNGGRPFVAYNNFRVILTYNNSIYYAGAINYMANEICRR